MPVRPRWGWQVKRVRVGARALDPVPGTRDPQPGLVEPGHLRLGDPVTHGIGEFGQPAGGAFGHRRDGAFRYRGAEQLGQRLRGALLGQELPPIQIQDDRGDPPPVGHLRADIVGRARAGRHTTRAAARDQPVLGHRHPHRRQVENLSPLHPGPGSTGQIGSAAAARAGLVAHGLIRVIHQPQRRARMPFLSTRFAAALAPQRLRRRLGKRRIRRRRLGKVLRSHPQPPLQLSDLSPQCLDHGPQLGVLVPELIVRGARTPTGTTP